MPSVVEKAVRGEIQAPLDLKRFLFLILSAIFLFIMHIFIPNIGGMIAHPREYIIWISIGTIIFLGILNVVIKRQLTESPLRMYLLVFILLLLLSTIFNPIKNMDLFIMNSAKLASGFLLWFALLQFNLTDREKLSILLLIFISAVIESVIGIMQFFGLYRYIPITPSPEVGMVGGAFQQKNLFASWIATGLIISLYIITTDRFESYKKIPFLASTAILSLSLTIAYSRTGLLGVGFGMAVILTMVWKRYLAVKRALIVWLLAFFIGIAGGLYLLSIKDNLGIKKLITRQIEWFSNTQQPSYTHRIVMARASLSMFKEKPLFGHGFSNFGSLYMYYQGRLIKSEPEYKEVIGDNYTSHPHNEILLIISETGIAGAVGVLILIYGFLKVVMSLKKEQSGLYIALLIPIVIHSLLEYPLHLSTAHYLLFVILIYMASSHSINVVQLRPSPFMAKSTLIISSSIYIVFLTYTIMTSSAYNGLVRWYIDYTETGKAEDRDILPSTKNLYLKNWAMPMYMFAKAEEAVKDVEKNKDFLDDFLEWSNTEKRRLPALQVFYYDANVLIAMGIHHKELAYLDEAMKTVEEGLLLYPNNKDLKKLKSRIVSEAFKAIFR